MAALRARGIFCFKVHGGPTMMAGLPDIIACVEGAFVGFETKMPSKRNNTSARQDYVHEAIRQSGGGAFVICSAREALQIVDSMAAPNNDPNGVFLLDDGLNGKPSR